MAEKKKKSVFDKLVDAVSDRDEKEAAAQAAAEKAAADKAAAEKAAAEKAAAARVAAAKAAAVKAAADKAAADKAAAEKAAAEKAAAAKAAADKVAAAHAAAIAAAEKDARDLAAKAAAKPKKGVVAVRSLYIRKSHTRNSEAVGGLVRGNVVEILETYNDGKDVWVRIGPDQWSAMIYKGETHIKLEE